MDIKGFENMRSLSIGIFIGLYAAATVLTSTINPPAGANSLSAALTPKIYTLGWLCLSAVLLSSITLAVTYLTNTTQRRSSTYLWKPQTSISSAKQRHQEKGKEDIDVDLAEGGNLVFRVHDGQEIIASAQGVLVPQDLHLADDERSVIEVLARRLEDAKNKDMLDIASTEDGSKHCSSEHSTKRVSAAQHRWTPVPGEDSRDGKHP